MTNYSKDHPEAQWLREDAYFDEDSWRSRSLCSDMPNADELFFPGDSKVTGKPPMFFIRQAKAICQQCPVIAQCRDYALRYRLTEFGVFGGLSANERRQLLKAIAKNTRDQETAVNA